jgi:hypothetical protein
MLAPPLLHDVGDVGDLRAEDERQSGRLDGLLVGSETMPASATTVTSRSWWAAMNATMVGSMVVVSARLPSKACTISGTRSHRSTSRW